MLKKLQIGKGIIFVALVLLLPAIPALAQNQKKDPKKIPAVSLTPETPVPAKEPVVLTVEKTLPCVVNINTEKLVTRAIQDPTDDIFNRYFGTQIYRGTYQQTVRSLGSGFLVSPDGYILTNEHVVSRAADLKISISTNDGKTYPGKYIYGDPDRDLAIIQILSGEAQPKFPFIDVSKLSPNLIGQTVIVLGNPIGFQSSVSVGILSGKDRTVGQVSGLLQTDAAINPGNSGGPIVDISGDLVGVSSMKIGQTQNGMAAENLGFAIPADIVSDWTENALAIARGTRTPPQPADPKAVLQEKLGLKLQNLTPELARELGFRVISGVLVADVVEDSPAAKSGIKPGMLLQSVGRYATTDITALPKELGSIKSGNEVTLLMVRIAIQGNVIISQKVAVRLIAR